MKAPKIILMSFAAALSFTAYSQETDKARDTAAAKEKVSTWGIYPAPQQAESNARDQAGNLQQDSSRQSFPAPNFGSYYIPVLGTYNSPEKNIVIAGDEKNPGKVWIEGLANERIYALLKEAPGTYKIPAQQHAKEGTLIYDDENKEVSICVGCGYKDKDPERAVVNSQASKKKSVLNFTGTRSDQGTVSSQ